MAASTNMTTIRMDDYTKAVVESAARYNCQTRTAFMISALREKAEEVIKERSATMREIVPMVLSPTDSKIFLEALEHDFEPSKALFDLKKHYESFGVVDRT